MGPSFPRMSVVVPVKLFPSVFTEKPAQEPPSGMIVHSPSNGLALAGGAKLRANNETAAQKITFLNLEIPLISASFSSLQNLVKP
jgi:hypothetical protein